ncbi:hypothetical protein [Longispora albida]|nr:hypothetical protein [Longispora albida]
MGNRLRVWCLRHGEAESNLAAAMGTQDAAPGSHWPATSPA